MALAPYATNTLTSTNTNVSFTISSSGGTFAAFTRAMRGITSGFQDIAATLNNVRCTCGERTNPHWEHTILDGCTWKG